MSVDNVTVNSAVGIDGNSYTTNVSNDQLTNEDFLKLMLEEMKMQDPTKPMDSQELMNSQLQMSQIQANTDMSKSLQELSKSYQASSLASAVSFMGRTIENGSTDSDTGMLNSYKVGTVESSDGDIFVNANKQTGYYHKIKLIKEDDDQVSYVDIQYDSSTGKIYNEDGTDSGVNVVINPDGSFKTVDGQYQLVDNNGEIITDEDILNQYAISDMLPVYSEETTKIPVNTITKVYG